MSKALELSQLANDVTYNEGTDTLSFGQANITVGTDVLLAYNDFSGDITVASNGAVTLATVNSNVGSFGSGSAIPVVTVNAKGLVTAVSTQAVNIVSTTDIAGDSGTDTITLGTDTLTFAGGTALTSTVTNNQVSIALDNTAVTAGSYGGSTAIPVITIDAQGRITAASTSSINTDLVSDTTPQLGGTLDANGNDIDMGTNLITDTKVGQWDTAYGWGDHGSAGYLTSIAADSINDTHIDFGTGTNQVSTADIPEQTNLYYTDARADARAQLKIDALVDSAPNTLDTLNELAAALGDDANFSTTITNSIATKLATSDFTSTANTWIATKSTSDLSEGTNLYYTNARADARIAAADTDALSEGSTNLYFTDARADARIALQAGANLDLSSKTTSDLSEGTNLYYTNARVDAHLNQSNPTAGYVLSWNGSDYAWVADSDTVYTSFNTDFDTRLGTKTTANLTEGTNLYYTDARADARVNAQTGSNLDLSSKDTDNLSEGTTNLYYTDARVKASTLTGGSLRGTVNNATVQYATSYSGTPAQGSFFFDSLNQKLKVYTGSAFVDAVPAGGGGGGGSATDANTTFRKYTYTVTSSTNTLTGKDDIVVTAGSFITGYQYQIISVGNTDFTAIGASANTVGVTFTATGAGTGTGTAGHVLNYVTNGTENVEVYVNGVKQVEGSSYDYVATTGSSVAFISNLQIGDVADIQIYELLTNSAYYTQSQTYTQAETNSQISTAVSAYLPLAGGTLTGNIAKAGDFTLDAGGDLILDADGAQIRLKDNGIEFGVLSHETPNLIIKSQVSNGDIVFKANDGGSTITTMTIKGDGGNVGIGTTSPDAILDVRGGAASRPTFIHASGYGGIQIAGTGASSGAALIFSNNYNTSVSEEYSIYLDGATDDLVFISGDPADIATEERMRLTDDSATTLLIKAKKSTFSSAAQLDLVGTNANSYGGSQIVTSRIDSKTDGGPYESKMRFWTNNGSNVLEEHMVIDHDGNVGIGTDNPQYDVDIHVANDDGLNIKGSTDTGNGWRIKPSGNDLRVGQSGVADRITLQDGGHFGINNTNPGYQLHVQDNTTWNIAAFASSYSTGSGLTFLATGAGGSDWSVISQGTGGGAGSHNLGLHLTNNQSGSGGTGYKMILAPDGSLQLSNGGTPTIKTGISNGRALTIIGEGTGNTSGSIVKMTGRDNNAGAGFVQTEVYALTGVTSNVEISRITGTGANGFRMLVEVTCTGHTGSRGNAHSIKKAYWDGGTNSVFLISEEQSDINPINVNIQCVSSNVLRVLLSSSDGTNGFNGVMEIKYYVPVDFAGNTWATS